MRIEGVESLERRGTHRLLTSEGKVVELQIAAIPLAVDVALSKALPAPQPPYMTTMGPDGKPSGRSRLEDDPAYRAKRGEHTLLLASATAYHGLCPDQGLEGDTPPGDDVTFYRSIQTELQDLGFTGEEIIRLASAIRRLASVTEDMLDQAADAFSQGTTD